MNKLALLSLAALPLFAAAQVPSYVPTNGLVGWWPFNGNANDESGNGNNGTVNGATLTTDRNGNVNAAYSFDGVNDNISGTSNNLNVSSTNRLSIAAWIMVNSLPNPPAAAKIITHTDLANATGQQYALSIGNDGSLYFLAGNGAFENNGPNVSPPVVSPSAWVLVAMTYDGDSIKLFFNGANVFTKHEMDFFPSNPAGHFYLSSFSSTQFNSMYNGSLDDIGIWNRALTPCEIEALYNSGNSGLTLTTSATNLCVSDGSATLLALPSGGTWSGTGVTGNAFNPAVSGAGTFYPVYTVTNASGCVVSDSIAITVDVCAGITENATSTFTVYPNPANNTITVSWSTADSKALTLRDAAGRVVRTYNVNGTQVQLSLEGLASGVYFLSVGGDTKAVRKIIKQ